MEGVCNLLGDLQEVVAYQACTQGEVLLVVAYIHHQGAEEPPQAGASSVAGLSSVASCSLAPEHPPLEQAPPAQQGPCLEQPQASLYLQPDRCPDRAQYRQLSPS